MTVTELKAIIKDWPELNDQGGPSEVWMLTGKNISNLVVEAIRLNDTDIIFEPSEDLYGA